MECTLSQVPVPSLCTPGVIYGKKTHVHHAYMVKKVKIPRRPALRKLRWRRTRISEWRDSAKLTQQQVTDLLAERGLELDRVSVVRIEGGKQMPTIEVLEAMASIFKTDIDSMLNFTPEQAAELGRLRSMEPGERDRMLRAVRAAVGEG